MNPAHLLDRHFDKLAKSCAPQVAISAPGLDYRYGTPDLPFHAASAGKLVTTALTMQLVEQGITTLYTPVASVLSSEEIANLFAPESEPTIEHLLTHTSGVADYFAGKVSSGERVDREVIGNLGRTWTADDLLSVSRERQHPVGRPGERYLYSDTGFVLLGRILEELTGRQYHELVHERIFEPLGMTRSFMPTRTRPASGGAEIAPLFLGTTDVSKAASISADWAGGGTAGTTDDWLTLSAAFHDGRLISAESLAYVTKVRNKFRAGLDYGAGTMTVRFEGFAPWLRNQPRLTGHLGITGAHVWHDPVHNAEIVLNVGSTKLVSRSFRALFEILRALKINAKQGIKVSAATK